MVVLVGGSAIAARAATAPDPASRYRTATVMHGDVEQELDLTGTVTPVQQASARFAVAGTVQSVAVAVGDNVTAGQVLVTLDPAPLQAAVTEAAAGLAGAKAALETAGTSTTTGGSSGTGTTGTTGGTGTTGTTGGTGTSPATASASTASASAGSRPTSGPTARPVDLTGPQRNVQQAQAAVDGALTAAASAVAAEVKACPLMATPPSAPPTTPPSQVAQSSTRSTPDTDKAARAACTQAVQAALLAQQQVSQAQMGLASAQQALTGALTRAAAAVPTSGTSSSPTRSGTPSATPTTRATGAAAAGTGSAGTSAGTTASRIDSAKVQVLQAQATVDAANSALAGATLTAPVGGTVAALPFTPGVAATTGQAVTLVGSGAVQVTIDVPLAQLPQVAVGQAARVTPVGSTAPVTGSVTQISLLPTSSTTTTYPVVVLVPAPPAALASGSAAGVAVVLGTARHVLVVPVSAVTRSAAGTASVLVLSDGTTRRTVVKTGVAGATSTEIVSGVAAGSRVVIADLSQALPSSSTTASTARFAGGGAGFGAGAGFAGGGTGAGFAGGGTGAGGARPSG